MVFFWRASPRLLPRDAIKVAFVVFGPSRHVIASNTQDDGAGPWYDITALPKVLGLSCPQLDKLYHRFYDSTTLRFSHREVQNLRDEVVRLQKAYRARREPELIIERRVRARDPAVRAAIIERVLLEDTLYRVLEELRLLCEEAVDAGADVRCEGD